MFEMLDESKGKAVGIRAEGWLTDADYKEFLPGLEELIRRHGRIRLLVDMEGLEGWEIHAAWDDFTFGMTHWNHFERMALVGDKKWEEVAAKVTNLLMRGETRFFATSEKDAAWAWIKE